MTFTHITAVVNESGYVSTLGGINDGRLINSEHVTASNAALFITLLSHVGNYLKRKKRDLFALSLLRRIWNEQRFVGSHCVQYGGKKSNVKRRTCAPLTCLMISPTYSITISSAAIGSIANRPHSWMRLGLKRVIFLRNCYLEMAVERKGYYYYL